MTRYQLRQLEKNEPDKFKAYFEQICWLSRLFKLPNDDDTRWKLGELMPIILTGHQKDIFFAIMTRYHDRVICLTPTRYGKSRIVAIATLLRILTNPNEKWVIVAPTEPKAQIIMNYIKQHLFDNEDFLKMVPSKFTDQREKIKHERSQKRITLSNGSSISILSADADTKSEGGQKLMGSGTANLIIDESCELDDNIYSKAFRMLGDSKDNFLIELGNPWKRNHFFKSFENPDYYKVHVSYQDALSEGRYTQKFVDEMRHQANFEVLMECKFPDADSIDALGYLPIFSESMISNAMREAVDYYSGRKILWVDVSYKGKDSNTWVLRCDNVMELLYKSNDENPLNVVSTTMEIAKSFGIRDEDIYIDATGGGNIIYNRFKELGYNINGIGFNDKPNDSDKYRDIKAEGFFLLHEWLSKGGIIIDNKDWEQLLQIKYKTTNGKAHIISKDELRKQGIHSPDVADAAMLTCVGGISNALLEQRRAINLKQHNQPNYD